MKLLSGFLISSFLIGIILISCGESPEKYDKRAYEFADTLIERIDGNLTFASWTREVWRTAIYDDEYRNPITGKNVWVSDFNKALGMYHSDMEEIYNQIGEKAKQLDSTYKTLSDPPKASEQVRESIKELYRMYLTTRKLYEEPSGNLNSYTGNINEKRMEFEELKNKINMEKMDL